VAWAAKVHQLSTKLQGPQCWIVALAFFGASLGLRILFADFLDPIKFLTFYPAIAGATLLCGWKRGVLVLALSTVSAWYFFYEPAYSFESKEKNTLPGLLSFLLVGGFLIVLVAGMADLIRRLETANHAQESLFRELQHRVANNLQVVVAMLQGIRRDLTDEATADAIAHAQDRIAMMSDLHRRLYDRRAYEAGLAPLVTDVLHEAFRDLPVVVAVSIAPDANLSLDQMTAISLLVNEAALNAAKHVFRKGAGTTFTVELLKQAHGLRLLIHDDGPGIKRDSLGERQSLGMSIMHTFAHQLGGSLRVNGPVGTTLKVEFPAGSGGGP
jgi:two-component sensor histidine kinase